MFQFFSRIQKMQKPVLQMTRQLIMFQSFGKTKMLKRKGKKSQLTVLQGYTCQENGEGRRVID